MHPPRPTRTYSTSCDHARHFVNDEAVTVAVTFNLEHTIIQNLTRPMGLHDYLLKWPGGYCISLMPAWSLWPLQNFMALYAQANQPRDLLFKSARRAFVKTVVRLWRLGRELHLLLYSLPPPPPPPPPSPHLPWGYGLGLFLFLVLLSNPTPPTPNEQIGYGWCWHHSHHVNGRRL